MTNAKGGCSLEKVISKQKMSINPGIAINFAKDNHGLYKA